MVANEVAITFLSKPRAATAEFSSYPTASYFDTMVIMAPQQGNPAPVFYRLGRGLLRLALGFYFSRIERFHTENVPLTGPVLFTSNHPNSLTDAFVIGTSIRRRINFVATVQLFQLKPVRWLLTRCGVIAINRVKDDPRAMRSVMDTFEACFRVLEQGEAIGIFPEGITHDEPQLKTVKTGAARMALELEQRHQGRLGLQIVPVGLTFSAKEKYRGEALINFGQPIQVAEFLPAYEQNRHQVILKLNEEVGRRIQSLILHLPNLERARIVEAVKRLYLDRLWAGSTVIYEPVTPRAGELLLTQAIAGAVERAFAENPARAAEFVRKLDYYQRALRRLHLSDEILAQFPNRNSLLVHSLAWAVIAVVGAPVALYGWVHRLIPYAIVRWIVQRVARKPPDKTQISTATIISGIVVFATFYGLCGLIFGEFFGWRAAAWYAFSLPVASLVAHYYLGQLRRLAAALRVMAVFLRAPSSGQRLLELRAELIALIEAERQDLAIAHSVGEEHAQPTRNRD
jgi:1-acyl-sn-glycerol-3-phosphate acyltransferase